MARPIKFRAWDKKEEKMYYNLTLENGDMGYFPGCDLCDQHVGAIKPILMQFTGLCDKNGKEIFEADIVKSSICTGEVFFDEYAWNVRQMPEYLKEDNPIFFAYSGSKNAEIVGNIYENKELLK